MADYVWDESLETGDPLVDQQHRNIHQIVADAEACACEPDALLRILDRLMVHVDCHFATEEDLMARSGFSGADAEEHVIEHRELTATAREIVLKVRSGELTDSAPVIEFLRDWLRTHVHERDRVLVEFVRSRSEVHARLPEPWASHPPQLSGSAA